MRHHQQCPVTPLQETLQPFYHLQVQMVRGFVQYQQVGFRQQHVGQCHPLLLSATQLPHGLFQVLDLQLRQHLLGLQHLLRISLVIETRIQHCLLRVKRRTLLQKPYLQVPAEHDVPRVVALLTAKYREQRRLPRPILRNQPHLLAFANGKTDVLKQLQGTERLAEMLYVQIRGHWDLIFNF